jgi:hypothetical protein
VQEADYDDHEDDDNESFEGACVFNSQLLFEKNVKDKNSLR